MGNYLQAVALITFAHMSEAASASLAAGAMRSLFIMVEALKLLRLSLIHI